MNLTASDVQKSCMESKAISHALNPIFKMFKSTISEAGKNGMTSVDIDVPTNFSVGNMDNKTAQTIIYERLINDLESNGFSVSLFTNKSSITYRIRWDIDNESFDLDAMRQIIAEHMIK